MTEPTVPPPPPGQPAKRVVANPQLGLASTLGGLALIVGAFLDAVTGPGAIFFQTSYIDGDGPIMLVLGAAIVVLGFFIGRAALPRFNALFIAAAGALAAIVAIIDIGDVQSKQIQGQDINIDPGPALYVCLAGGILAAVLGIAAYVAKRDITNEP